LVSEAVSARFLDVVPRVCHDDGLRLHLEDNDASGHQRALLG
jgi:hypothetical protein